MPRVIILRMGHRPTRDKRVTTHVGLVARAFGADGMIIADTKDRGVEESIRKVVGQWGGPFFVRSGDPWKGVAKKWRDEGGLTVHLTMYGEPLDEALQKVGGKDLLIAVGAEKMPGELFHLADLNVAVGAQPHSEVAALAVFLDRLFGGAELKKEFKGKKLMIIPSKEGKKVEKIG